MSNIKDRIQKILEIAKRGGTEAEASTALSMAHELLAKHNLKMSDIEEREVKDEDIIEAREEGKPGRTWQGQIWYAVSELYFCQYYTSDFTLPSGKRGRSYVVVGRESNVETVREVAGYLTALCDSIARNEPNVDILWRNSFKNGFSARIGERCRETRAAATKKLEANGAMLPIVALYELTKRENKDFLAARGVRLTVRSARSSYRNAEGYRAGRDAGSSASLSKSATLKIGH